MPEISRRFLKNVLALAIIPISVCQAQSQPWHQIQLGGSPRVAFVGSTPDGKLVAETYSEGFYVSDDGGVSWSLTDAHRGFRSWTQGPGAVVYAQHFDGTVDISFDEGENWEDFELMCGDEIRPVLDVAVSDSALVAAVRECGFFRSVDAGALWAPVASEENVERPHAFVTMPSGRLYAATSRGIYGSDDTGRTWFDANEGFPPYVTADLTSTAEGTLLASSWGELYRLAEAASTWEKVADFGVSRFATLPSGTVFAAAFNVQGRYAGAVFRSVDDGSTWKDVSEPMADVNDVGFDREGKLLAATSRGVFSSTDEGETWVRSDSGIILAHVNTLEMDAEDRILASVDGDLLRENVAGVFDTLSISHATALHVEGGTLYAGTWEAVFGSTDGGSTWDRVRSFHGFWDQPRAKAITGGGDDGSLYVLFADLYKRKDEYAYLHASADGGATWTVADVPSSSNHYIQPIAFQVIGDGALLIGGNGLFLKAGQSWTQASAPSALYHSVASCDSGDLYAAGSSTVLGEDGGVYRSSDSGSTWLKVLSHKKVLSVACSESTVIAGGASGEVFVSSDGATWEEIGRGLGGFAVTDIEIGKDRRVILATYGGGLFENTEPIIVSVEAPRASKAGTFVLNPPYPNPLSQSTNVTFVLPEPGAVTLRVYDVLGREIHSIHRPHLPAGEHRVTLDAGEISSGMYVVEVSAGSTARSRPVTVVR